MELLNEISKELQAGNTAEVLALTRKALEAGFAPEAILEDALIAGMNVIGEHFKRHDIFLPEVLLAAQAMNAGMETLQPFLEKQESVSRGRVVIGTVKGDRHDIGKNLVAIMLRGAGFEVIDLGSDVSPERFVEAAKKEKAGIIGMSALLTTTMPCMKDVVELIQKEGLSGTIKTVIGGAPVSEEYAKEIGADAYGYDGANAVERVKGIIGRG
jgi:5-methyltetrahydrofolate--homocysteine methyltransferase